MARKYGKVNKMSTNFEDYSYIINGVGGIGKTTMAWEIGKLITGDDEGTFIITCGAEPAPIHIPGAFGDVAKDFKTFMSIVKELCDNKEEYPNTKFVAIDSLDEYARIAENYVVQEWNSSCAIDERAKSIKQAYKGFQGGENRACDLMIQQIMKLQAAGYSMLEIGHTKIKTKEDPMTDIKYEQLTCNLDNKYYNALKDKVNLVAMCYLEKTIENIEDRKNAFTKKNEKVGDLTSEKRIICYRDDDMAIDTKSHFEYIEPKVEFSAQNFIEAVRAAIDKKVSAYNGTATTVKANDSKKKKAEPVEVETNNDDVKNDMEDDTPPFDVDDEIDDIFAEDDDDFDIDEAKDKIRPLFKEADTATKKEVRVILDGEKLNDVNDVNKIKRILEVLS